MVFARAPLPPDPSKVNRFDRSVIGNDNPLAEALSDAMVAVAVLGPIALDAADVGVGPKLARDLTVYAEVLSISGALVLLAKHVVRRPLPRVYAGDSELAARPAGYHSFYSGHTAIAISALTAASMTYAARRGHGLWPWLLTAVLGASVAVARVEAGRHFYSDVVAGALAGFGMGWLVPRLQRWRLG